MITLIYFLVVTRSSPNQNPSEVGSLPDFPGQFFEEDLGYIEDMAHLPPIAGENWRTYAIRGRK